MPITNYKKCNSIVGDNFSNESFTNNSVQVTSNIKQTVLSFPTGNSSLNEMFPNELKDNR